MLYGTTTSTKRRRYHTYLISNTRRMRLGKRLKQVSESFLSHSIHFRAPPPLLSMSIDPVLKPRPSNLEQTEDTRLAEETQSNLVINNVAGEEPGPPQAPAKRSLSALAAAHRKPPSSNPSKLSSLAAAGEKVPDSSVKASGLSKLAAKSQAASSSSLRRPLSSLAGAKPHSAVNDPDNASAMHVEVDEGLPSASKLSKLQQRILQRGNKEANEGNETAGPSGVEDTVEKDTWHLPSSALFSSAVKPPSKPSSFAGVITPHQNSTIGADSSTITTQALQAGLDKLSKLDAPSANQQKMQAQGGHLVKPVRR